MTSKQLYLRSLPALIAAPLLVLYLMGTSDFEDLLYIEQLKQEQRDRVRASAVDIHNAYKTNLVKDPSTRAIIYSISPANTNDSNYLPAQEINLVAR